MRIPKLALVLPIGYALLSASGFAWQRSDSPAKRLFVEPFTTRTSREAPRGVHGRTSKGQFLRSCCRGRERRFAPRRRRNLESWLSALQSLLAYEDSARWNTDLRSSLSQILHPRTLAG